MKSPLLTCCALVGLAVGVFAWCYFAFRSESQNAEPVQDESVVQPATRTAKRPLRQISHQVETGETIKRPALDLETFEEPFSIGVERIPVEVDADQEVQAVQFCNAWMPDEPWVFDEAPPRMMFGVDGQNSRSGREPRWADQQCIPWEAFAYGEYIGPFRTPHVADYRLRVGDVVDFVYVINRTHPRQTYRLFPGDIIQVFSANDPSLNQNNVTVLSDGTIGLPLVGQVMAAGKTLDQLGEDLNQRYSEFLHQPSFVVQVVQGDTPLRDLGDAVDARFGQGGRSRQVSVAPDGTVRLPGLGAVATVGMSLDEIAREVNTRYAMNYPGLTVTPILVSRAPRSVFVLGQVGRPGRYELQGPTTVMQALSLAEGWRIGSNLRQIIVFRRDEQWRLMATKIDLQGALIGRAPHPADEIWLRDSDIVLVPQMPVQRFSEAVELYLTRSLYALFPQQGVVFNFDGLRTF